MAAMIDVRDWGIAGVGIGQMDGYWESSFEDPILILPRDCWNGC